MSLMLGFSMSASAQRKVTEKQIKVKKRSINTSTQTKSNSVVFEPNNEPLWVRNRVGRNGRTETVDKNETITVSGNRAVSVGTNQSINHSWQQSPSFKPQSKKSRHRSRK